MSRLVTAIVNVKGTDDENWPESDEHTDNTQRFSLVLNEDQPASFFSLTPVRWGGECRVEVDFRAQAARDGRVTVHGDGRLYEGTSENTGDLDGSGSFDIVVVRNTAHNPAATNHQFNLRNDDEGGDHAEVYLSFTNTLVETD